MPNRTKLTPKKKGKFLDTLRETCNVTLSAESIGMARQYMYEVRNADERFAAEWDNAINEAVDRLEGEVHRRAFAGTNKPIVYQGAISRDEDGKAVTVKEYSDTLAIFLLKAHRPEKYRERQSVEHSGKGGGPIPIEDVNMRELGRRIAYALRLADKATASCAPALKMIEQPKIRSGG